MGGMVDLQTAQRINTKTLHAMSKMKYLSGNTITAKNGHLSFEIERANTKFVSVLGELLRKHFGFTPVGEPTVFVSEVVAEIELSGLKLGLGWDNWSGAYVMAFCEEGDGHIKKMADYLNEAKTNLYGHPRLLANI
ncbi:hypothetical protein ABIS04_06820 [Shewanella sp. H8]|uniref:hypothetical protein n=1 Tax=Shewanella sp. H8 TaxID=3342676 RepID=UPI0033157217